MTPMERIAYDEFGLFHENASEYGLTLTGPPSVRRLEVPVEGARTLSALQWGEASPQIVFLHGGAQNSHTWDTVILALGPELSALAIDLPGHGHSGWRDDGRYTPQNMADDVAVVVGQLAPEAILVVGMSMGGMTSIQLAVRHPQLVRRLLLVDVTPGVNAQKAKAITDFVDGPQSFPDFASLLARTMEHNPTRSESSHASRHPAQRPPARRRLLAVELRPGQPSPRERRDESAAAGTDDIAASSSPMWDDFARIASPLLLARGGVSPVVDDDDVAEARRRQPAIEVEVVDGAGHSIQGDRPLELAAIIRRFAPLPD